MPAPAAAQESLIVATSASDPDRGTYAGLLVDTDLVILSKRAARALTACGDRQRPTDTAEVTVATAANPAKSITAHLVRWPTRVDVCVYGTSAALAGGHDLEFPALLPATTDANGESQIASIVRSEQEVFAWSGNGGALTESVFTVRPNSFSRTRFVMRPVTPLQHRQDAAALIGSSVWSREQFLGIIESVTGTRAFNVVSPYFIHTFLPRLPEAAGQVGHLSKQTFQEVCHSLHADLQDVGAVGLSVSACDAVKEFLGAISHALMTQAKVYRRGTLFNQLVEIYVQHYYSWNDDATTMAERRAQIELMKQASRRFVHHTGFTGQEYTVATLLALRAELGTAAAALSKFPDLFPRTIGAVARVQANLNASPILTAS